MKFFLLFLSLYIINNVYCEESTVSLDSSTISYVAVCDQVAGRITNIISVKGNVKPIEEIRNSVEKLLINDDTKRLPKSHQMCLVLIDESDPTRTKRKFVWIRNRNDLVELEKIIDPVVLKEIRLLLLNGGIY